MDRDRVKTCLKVVKKQIVETVKVMPQVILTVIAWELAKCLF